MTNSNRKGKRGERELAKALTETFGVSCRRGQQYSGIEGEDVVGLPGVHIESKRTEKLSLYAAIEQAVRDADESQVPTVFHKKNRKEWLCVVRLDDLPKLVERLYLLMCSEGESTEQK